MLLLMMGLLILLVGATGFIGNQVITGILNEYIGRAALNVSKTVSLTGVCLLYTSPSPRDSRVSRMPSSA